MERDLVSRWNAPYVGFDFDQMFAGSYRRALAELRETIVLGEYPGSDFHSSPQTVRQLDALQRRAIRSRPGKVLRWLSGGKLDGSGPREDILVCRKFAPDELAKILARFVDTIFGDLVHSGGTQGWCEDTPANTLHIPFLLKLFPDSRHIHMTRNPYGVVSPFR